MGAESAARAKADAQLDIEGFQHVLDNSAIGHVHKRHGPGMERRAGQVPVERSDFERLPAIVQSPDKITVERRPDNLDTIVIEKRINGVVYVVEEVRTGRRKLALKTMYKKLADTGAVPGSADAAVDLYVRNDPGRPPDDIIARPQIIDLNLPGTTYGRYSLAYKHGISGSDAEAAKYVSEALTGDAVRQVKDRLGEAGGPLVFVPIPSTSGAGNRVPAKLAAKLAAETGGQVAELLSTGTYRSRRAKGAVAALANPRDFVAAAAADIPADAKCNRPRPATNPQRCHPCKTAEPRARRARRKVITRENEPAIARIPPRRSPRPPRARRTPRCFSLETRNSPFAPRPAPNLSAFRLFRFHSAFLRKERGFSG